MFDPLPSIVRMRREERGLTQERLAKMAKVSRGQLIAFEKGEQNITLLFLLKIARALELTDLPIAELHLRPVMPELTTLIAAADAIAAADRVVASAVGVKDQLAAASERIQGLLETAMARDSEEGIAAAARRVAMTPPDQRPAAGRTLRQLADAPHAPSRASRPSAAAKPAARKRSR